MGKLQCVLTNTREEKTPHLLEHGSMSVVGMELLSSPSNPERLRGSVSLVSWDADRKNYASVPLLQCTNTFLYLDGANEHNKIPVSTS
jgi:hypothetical protein